MIMAGFYFMIGVALFFVAVIVFFLFVVVPLGALYEDSNEKAKN